MSSDLNLSPVSLAAESRPSFVACAAVPTHDLSSARPDVLSWFKQQFLQLADAVDTWLTRRAERGRLAQLDAWTMRDLGLTESEIWREQQKYPWQP